VTATEVLRVGLDVSAVPARPAGAGHYTLALASALDARPDVELTVVCRRGDDRRWATLTPGATIVAGAPLRRPLRLAWEQTVLPVLLRRLAIDLFHSPHYTMPEATRLRQVVTIHDLTFFDHPEWHERTKVPVFRRAIKVAARRADALICVSQHTAARLQELVAPRGRASVVLHGVDHERFRPDPIPDRRSDKEILGDLGVRQPFVAFVGTLEPRKAVDGLVQAFDRMAAAHPDLALVLAGGDGWGGAAIDQAIGSARHRERIVRTGYVPDLAVPALLRQAAAVAYPAAEEGFGMPAIEALACEAPLVTTKGSVMEEMVGEAALLVPPGDIDALAGALDMLVRGDARLEERRALGRQIAGQHTWERCADGHVQVYRAVVSG
jgi:glycosyltransferase involved in cell wall biosynthesis